MSLNIRYENRPLPYAQGLSSSITFILTDDCQLRCRYCYLHHKSRSHIMPFHVARTTVDYVLSHRDLWPSPAVIFDFMGGEPFLEISLMDRICDYIKKSMYVADHPWFDDYLISCSTNGLLYKSDRVQRFIAKNHEHLDISISLDGTREKHDCNRVFPDGSGSYDRVRENFSLYLEQFPRGTTKATISSADIPHVARSVLHLFSLGVGFVDINVVFEDVWRPGDSEAFEAQLLLLADTMISQRLYEQHSCSFFSADLGRPMDPVYENTNWCGTGRMLAVDQDGVFYPCNRFTQNALTCGKPRAIGDIRGGIDENKRRPFLLLNRRFQSPSECMECSVASGCAWCPGQDYDASSGETIWNRTTFHCEMHKATVRANRYYWSRLRAGEDIGRG